MLYLFDKYTQEYPRRQVSVLKKFESAPEYLHKMTSVQVNEITKNFQPVIKNTADKNRRFIAQYLTWLTENGIKVSLDAKEIDLPVEAQFPNYIFSAADIHKYYEKLFVAVDRIGAISNITYSKEMFLMPYAAGILGYYGLTAEQIIALDLSDIQEEGVLGYDLPLTKEDIDILLRYKNMNTIGNNFPLKGTKFIRSFRSVPIVDASFFVRPFERVRLEKEYTYLSEMLKHYNVVMMGKFDRAYQHEQKFGIEIVPGSSVPQWFYDLMEVRGDWIFARKKEYLAYKEARDKQ